MGDVTAGERDWSDTLRTSVHRIRRHRRWLFAWYVPYSGAVWWMRRRLEHASKPYPVSHYDGWQREDLVWRILFLQEAAANAWAEREAWRLVICPLIAAVAIALVVFLGR